MKNWQIRLSIFLNYFVFAILLNSVGTVILQVQNHYGVSASDASVLEAYKDLSIALVSFLVASYLTRIGYRRAMLIALGLISIACFVMPSLGSFTMTKVLFAVTGTCFALIKVSVYATIGLVTTGKQEHASLMNFIESFFMIGILTGYFIFSAFMGESGSSDWLKVYYFLGCIASLAFLLLFFTHLDESAVKAPEARPAGEDFREMFRLAIRPVVLVFIISAFIYVLIEQSIMSWLPTFNSQVLRLPDVLSVQMASILAASTALGRFLAGVVLRKVQWFMVLAICLFAAGGLVFVAIPMAGNATGSAITGWSDAPAAAFIFPLIGLFLAPVYPAINSVILSTLPPRLHGTMSGLIVIFSALGGTTGSIITGHIFEAYGGETAFYFSLIPVTLLLVCLYLFNRLQKTSDGHIAFKNSATH